MIQDHSPNNNNKTTLNQTKGHQKIQQTSKRDPSASRDNRDKQNHTINNDQNYEQTQQNAEEPLQPKDTNANLTTFLSKQQLVL